MVDYNDLVCRCKSGLTFDISPFVGSIQIFQNTKDGESLFSEAKNMQRSFEAQGWSINKEVIILGKNHHVIQFYVDCTTLASETKYKAMKKGIKIPSEAKKKELRKNELKYYPKNKCCKKF